MFIFVTIIIIKPNVTLQFYLPPTSFVAFTSVVSNKLVFTLTPVSSSALKQTTKWDLFSDQMVFLEFAWKYP